jgi:maltokinase
MAVQRIHGDLHLGQTLRARTGWLFIDFEGEPAVPLAERNTPHSTLQDVAGMLRSFDYAAQQLLVERPVGRSIEARVSGWARSSRDAFCDGYGEVLDDPRDQAALLRALELHRAVYEVGYELANRPDWVAVPMRSIARLLVD